MKADGLALSDHYFSVYLCRADTGGVTLDNDTHLECFMRDLSPAPAFVAP